jgi:FAD/FMN-containing dehydrogenase
LQKAIQGTVIPRRSADYVRLREAMVWNKRVANVRSPDAIVQVTSAQDVAASIRFARKKGMKVSVRGSGHHYHGAVLRDGGLLLDLSRLKAIEIDAPNRRGSMQPAAKGGEISAALALHKLAFPVGHCSDVSMSGYILNGGYGWNFGEWGAACMSVRGMEMVTAAGEILYADESKNTDLFWAARGAGPGFFAVVTRYDVVLYPLPSAIRIFSATFALESAPIVARWATDALRTVDPTAEVICALGPLDASGQPVITISAVPIASSQRKAIARLGALRALPAGAKPIGEVVDREAKFEELFALTGAGFPAGKRMHGDMHWTSATMGELMLACRDLVVEAPPAPSAIAIVALGGGAKPKRYDAALSVGGGSFIGAYGFWDDAAQDETSRAWVRSVMRAVEPFETGSYIGEADLSVSPDRVRECFSPEAWDKLVALKKKYDPDNLFFSYLQAPSA